MVENVEDIESIKNQLSLKWNFWDTLKDINSALGKLQIAYKGQPVYLQLLCKFSKRCIE